MKSCSGSNGSSSKVDRKTVEKNRRIHMKNLCFKLGSLIPKEDRNTKDPISQHDHLDQAATYIRNLKARIEKLKQRKNRATDTDGQPRDGEGGHEIPTEEIGLPVVEVTHRDPVLEVVLITGQRKKFMFYKVIGVLVEEGVEVVNASFSVVGDRIFYTVHCQATSSRGGVDASRISERLKVLIQ
ncbi:uncharacterized protein M6B38_318935 [Iris pallida]|uniref:BHLH domain-containing protein n=1 Tax=Iris pallida TaxID=29817 RepID=A0AAX6FWW4_IRIPA|nr:uncharacterized protein M6B38_396365 [Iris pallida]KAJ6838736.1 uncharacterized protein M6B38_318935 [Iris pallida]